MHKGWYQDIDEDDDNGFAQFGGYMQAKKAKLIKQVREEATERTDVVSNIFQGVAIFVNGYTKPSAEELKTLMAQHSGTYHVYQMPSTTHIIASNLPNVKINKLGPLPIVKPNWIEDSITLGRLLDYSNYLLYTNQNRTQPQLTFAKTGPSEKTKTASDPSFLSEFYGNSRLHLIATLGAEFKQFVNDLRANKSHKFPGLEILKSNIATNSDALPCKDVIMHIDMDCFFVSVGIRNRPHLRGKPVAVTHSKTGQGRMGVDRSVEIAMYKERLPDGAEFRLQDIDDKSSLSEIASCSYEARAKGVKNGMFMGQALKICPELNAIPYDFEGYREVSKTLYSTIAEYTLNIEAVSCDEMYVNISNILQRYNLCVDNFATHIRQVIKSRTGCPCSTGFGSNRLQARLATKRAKPDGSYYLIPSEVESYFYEMSLAELPGVGRAILTKMKNLGLETCGDVQQFDLNTLRMELGHKIGETIMEQSKGVDKKPLQYEHERKSVSAEVNYGIRFQTKEESLEFLERLSSEVTNRLKETKMKAKCITLKLMVRADEAPTETAKYLGHGVCDSMSRSSSVPTATEDVSIITREVKNIFEKLCVPFNELRGIGIQLSRLEKCREMNPMIQNFLASSSKLDNDSVRKIKSGDADNSTSYKTEPTKICSPQKSSITRGRPKKNQSLPKTENASKNLSHYFKSTQKDRLVKKPPTLSTEQVDLSVLQELPEDVRLEIIKEYNLKLDVPSVSNEPQINPNLVPEDKLETKITVAEPRSNFDSLSHDDFINMLRNWMESGNKPMDVDVNMLSEYLQELAIHRKIERVMIYAKFLHRNIEERKYIEWKAVYEIVSEKIQKGMMQSFGKNLLIPKNFSF